MLISYVAEGDVVGLSNKPLSDVHSKLIISKPLSHGGETPVPGKSTRGMRTKLADSIAMDDIIGKGERNFVKSAKGKRYMLHEPTLAEYLTYCARIVTPVGLFSPLSTAPILTSRRRSTRRTQTSLSLSSTSIPAHQVRLMAQMKGNWRFLKLGPAMDH
jgi:hypothetical protein